MADKLWPVARVCPRSVAILPGACRQPADQPHTCQDGSSRQAMKPPRPEQHGQHRGPRRNSKAFQQRPRTHGCSRCQQAGQCQGGQVHVPGLVAQSVLQAVSAEVGHDHTAITNAVGLCEPPRSQPALVVFHHAESLLEHVLRDRLASCVCKSTHLGHRQPAVPVRVTSNEEPPQCPQPWPRKTTTGRSGATLTGAGHCSRWHDTAQLQQGPHQPRCLCHQCRQCQEQDRLFQAAQRARHAVGRSTNLAASGRQARGGTPAQQAVPMHLGQ
mmetsp:Transcript_87979/g.244167  ORF Transcript_87979/g.244167 Transcript_87979/m.244167 type:complete len:271 (-) Transcript_87979:113-925(-)